MKISAYSSIEYLIISDECGKTSNMVYSSQGYIDANSDFRNSERDVPRNSLGTRRDFLKGSAWMLGLAAMSGCMGGHDGMDFIMDLRWAYCLQNGLPLDMDVYDLASWSAIVPCSAKSALKMGERVEIPDFTRGAWKSAKPLNIGAIDLKKMNLKLENVKRDDSQLSV